MEFQGRRSSSLLKLFLPKEKMSLSVPLLATISFLCLSVSLSLLLSLSFSLLYCVCITAQEFLSQI